MYESRIQRVDVHEYSLFPRRRHDRGAMLTLSIPRDGPGRMNDAEIAAIVQSFRFGDASVGETHDASNPLRGLSWPLTAGIALVGLLVAFLLRAGLCCVSAGLVCRRWSFGVAAKTTFWIDLTRFAAIIVVALVVVAALLARVVASPVVLLIAVALLVLLALVWVPMHWLRRCYDISRGRAFGVLLMEQAIMAMLWVSLIVLAPPSARARMLAEVEALRQRMTALQAPAQGATPTVQPAQPAAPAPIAAPQPTATEWRLGGVSRARGQAVALINSQALSVGDRINGYTVAAIEGSRVTLTSADETITLDIK